MVRFKGRDVRKLSPGKATLAGEKQVFRKSDQNGRYLEDIIGQRNDVMAEGKPLLEKVMENGKLLRPHSQLQTLQETFKENFAALDDRYKSIKDHKAYPVKLSTRLQNLQKGNS
jgi:nicotinate phosphoribosyltransferase